MKLLPLTSVAVLALCAGVVVAAQVGQATPGQAPPPPQNAPLIRTASIAGQVVDADTGESISGAVVRLTMRTLAAQGAAAGRGGRGAAPLSAAEQAANSGMDFVMTDSSGRFVFHDLPKGPALLVATAGGFVERPGVTSRPLQLSDGQHLTDHRLTLVKTASLSGVIVDEAGEPVVGMQVRAMRRDMPAGAARYTITGNARTDDRGLYRIDGLVPGQFFVLVPQTQTTVPVANVEKNSDAIGGVLGANSPIVEALTGGMQNMLGSSGVRVGDQMWQSGSAGNVGAMAAPPPPVNGRVAAYQTTFYPGVMQVSQATAFTLKSGESRTNVDWQIRPTGVARITGQVTGPDGPAGSLALRLVQAPGGADDDALPVANATTSADGAFAFFGVPTGQYIVKATQVPRAGLPAGVPAELMASLPPQAMAMIQGRGGGSGDASYLRAPIGVGDKDVVGLTLSLRPGAKVSGRVVFDGAAAPPTLAQIQAAQVSLVAANGPAGQGGQNPKLNADNTFKTGAYGAGIYTLNISGIPAAWMIKSALIGGRDAVATGFELGENDIADAVITYTDRIPTITGTVKTEGMAPLPSTSVILVTADYRAWMANGAPARGQVIGVVQPNGAYTIGRLQPGDYLIAAVADDALATDHDAAFYDALARLATRVTVGDGEKKTQELRFIRSIR